MNFQFIHGHTRQGELLRMRTIIGVVQYKRNRCASVVENEGEDRISALRDSVLSNILNFLPIEDAVATFSLLRRWRPIWTSNRNLCFNDRGAIGTTVASRVRLAAF